MKITEEPPQGEFQPWALHPHTPDLHNAEEDLREGLPPSVVGCTLETAKQVDGLKYAKRYKFAFVPVSPSFGCLYVTPLDSDEVVKRAVDSIVQSAIDKVTNRNN
jgi:hypothetical protein